MIVRTGKIIRIENDGYFLEKSCETPGAVRVVDARPGAAAVGGQSILLPGNKEAATRFIEAYLAAVDEDIEYRKSEVR